MLDVGKVITVNMVNQERFDFEKPKQKRLEILYFQTADLIPNPTNARFHPETQINELVASINKFGWTNPILIDADKNVLLGHGRLLAAKQMGMKEVPTLITDLETIEDKLAVNLTDNSIASNSFWDEELLATAVGNLHSTGYEISVLALDFTQPMFEPIISPDSINYFIKDGDIDKAKAHLAGRYGGSEVTTVSVCCPNCGTDFEVNG